MRTRRTESEFCPIGAITQTIFLECARTSANVSHPKYRYAHLWWIIIGGLTCVYAICHHLNFSGGSIGSWWNKWGIRRHTFRIGRLYSHVLPSNNMLVIMFIVAFTTLCLALLGPDHLASDIPVWNFVKRDSPDALQTLVTWTVEKDWWTVGNRFGMMVFCCLPFLIILALKAPPFAILSLPFFTHVHWDKIGTFHRAGGWFVYFMVTIHVYTWTVQLFKNTYHGVPMWKAMLTTDRFRFGITAYCMWTLAMVTSIKWVRNRYYGLFYWVHVVCMIGGIICAMCHHSIIWYYAGIALIFWAGDKFCRFIRYMYINGFPSRAAPVPHKADLDGTIAHLDYVEKALSFYSSESSSDVSALPPPGTNLLIVPRPPPIPAGYAQAQLLPSRTVRLTIRTARPMVHGPGQSVLLTLPDITRWRSHPFTVSSNDPYEIVLIIKARNGTTRKLYDYVREQYEKTMVPDRNSRRMSIIPEAKPVHIRARIEGPMGSAGRVAWTDYTNVLMVCGGSGVTFGLAMIDYLSSVMSERGFLGKTKRLRFVWIVREYAEITWAASALRRFSNRLDESQLQIDIYVTGGATSAPIKNRTPLSSRPGSSGHGDETTVEELSPPSADRYVVRNDSADSLYSQYEGTGTRAPQRGYYDGEDPETGLAYDQVIGLTNFEGEEDQDDPNADELSRKLAAEGRVRRARSRKMKQMQRNMQLQPPGSEKPPLSPLREKAPLSPALPKSPHSPRDNSLDRQRSPRNGPFIPPRSEARRSGTEQDSKLAEILTTDSPQPAEHMRSESVSSCGTAYDRYEPFRKTSIESVAPSIYDVEMARSNAVSLCSRTGSMVQLEDTKDGQKHRCSGCGRHGAEKLWIDEGDYAAAHILSENAHIGRPKLASIVQEELERAEGATIIGNCGPVLLNTSLRNIVSKSIDAVAIARGDRRGHVTIYSEDFEM